MTSYPRDALTLRQCLGQQPLALTQTFERARRLSEISLALRDWSPEPWMSQIRVANIRGDTLVIYSASAAALVPLRHRSAALLSWLNDRYQLTCTRLDAKVRPPLADAKG
ncbi:MAG TPA: DciA family protein [Solimonas sp.]